MLKYEVYDRMKNLRALFSIAWKVSGVEVVESVSHILSRMNFFFKKWYRSREGWWSTCLGPDDVS